MLKEDVRFLKHADRGEANAVREFHPGTNHLFLIMSVVGLDRMGEKRSDLKQAFMFWLYLHNPAWFPEDVAKERIPIERLAKMRAMDKRGFFDECVNFCVKRGRVLVLGESLKKEM